MILEDFYRAVQWNLSLRVRRSELNTSCQKFVRFPGRNKKAKETSQLEVGLAEIRKGEKEREMERERKKRKRRGKEKMRPIKGCTHTSFSLINYSLSKKICIGLRHPSI